MKKVPLFFAVFVLALAGCQSNEVMESKNLAQSEIHQAYSVEYDQTEQLISVNAEFRAAGPNGTTLVLSEPSDVRCDEEEMKLDTYLLGGAHYVYSKKSEPFMTETVHLSFVDLDKKTYKNDVDLYAVFFDPQLGNLHHLSRSQDKRIVLKTHPLEDNETMTLNIQGDSLSTEIPNPDVGGMSIPKESLQIFGIGEKLTLQIIRRQEGRLGQATTRGGTYTVTVYSPKEETRLKE